MKKVQIKPVIKTWEQRVEEARAKVIKQQEGK